MSTCSSPESTASLYELEELDIHSCIHCQKVIVNQEYDFDMTGEETEWFNVHLRATLGDVLEGSRGDCEFAIKLVRLFTNLPTDTHSAEFELCAKLYTSKENRDMPDSIGTFGFWNSATRRVVMVSGEISFSCCTPEGEHPG